MENQRNQSNKKPKKEMLKRKKKTAIQKNNTNATMPESQPTPA